MESEVRRLFIEYGVKNVMSCATTISKALYEELKEMYGETVVVEPVETVEALPAEKKEKKRIIRKAVEPVETPVETAVEPVATNEKVVEVVTLRVKKKAVPPVEVQQSGEEDSEESNSDVTVPVDNQKTYPVKTAEELKNERHDHREAVEKKRAEIEGQGIEPESLLTKENLEKWLGSGMSYQRIAKEMTGCHEADISRYAKRFGLKSIIAGIIAGKYKNKK